jgi:formylglycine-generating enzyme required for sulfatase activity
MKFAVTVTITMSLLFLTSCGEGNEIHDTTIRIAIAPTSQSVEAGGSVELTVDARNTDIIWPDTVEGSYTVNNHGNRATYRPPSVAGTYRFTVTAAADPSRTVTARITVVYADPQITITPTNAEIKTGSTLQLSAEVTIPFGQPQRQDPIWEVSGACGRVDQNGLFSASRAGDCTVRVSLRDHNNRRITESVVVRVTNPTLDDVLGDMVEVSGGTFIMGCPVGQGRDNCPVTALAAHPVTLGTFYIGKYAVTQFLWKQIMGININPSGNREDNLPVENVSWDEVQRFIERLNERTGRNYRLPTEAEWEYAARGGSLSRNYMHSGSNTLDDVGWYDGNGDGTTRPVGMKQPNELGLYDMSGNVDEWTSGGSPSDDPTGPARIVRGGSSVRDAEAASVFSRGGCVGMCNPNPYLGFRLAITSIR